MIFNFQLQILSLIFQISNFEFWIWIFEFYFSQLNITIECTRRKHEASRNVEGQESKSLCESEGLHPHLAWWLSGYGAELQSGRQGFNPWADNSFFFEVGVAKWLKRFAVWIQEETNGCNQPRKKGMVIMYKSRNLWICLIWRVVFSYS